MLDDNQGIACTLLPPNAQGEPIIYNVDGATDYYVNSPYEPDSDYYFTMAGSRPHVRIVGVLPREGGHLPRVDRLEVPWVGIEGVPEAQGKRRRTDDAIGDEPSAADSEALRVRARGPRRWPRPCATASRRRSLRGTRLSRPSPALGRKWGRRLRFRGIRRLREGEGFSLRRRAMRVGCCLRPGGAPCGSEPCAWDVVFGHWECTPRPRVLRLGCGFQL